jgi:hypothetical protein
MLTKNKKKIKLMSEESDKMLEELKAVAQTAAEIDSMLRLKLIAQIDNDRILQSKSDYQESGHLQTRMISLQEKLSDAEAKSEQSNEKIAALENRVRSLVVQLSETNDLLSGRAENERKAEQKRVDDEKKRVEDECNTYQSLVGWWSERGKMSLLVHQVEELVQLLNGDEKPQMTVGDLTRVAEVVKTLADEIETVRQNVCSEEGPECQKRTDPRCDNDSGREVWTDRFNRMQCRDAEECLAQYQAFQDRITAIRESLGAIKVFVRVFREHKGETNSISSSTSDHYVCLNTQEKRKINGSQTARYSSNDQRQSEQNALNWKAHCVPNQVGFGAFESVSCPPKGVVEKNADFAEILNGSLQQIRSRNIVVFGLGSSGSGKTYAMLGNGRVDGALTIFLRNIMQTYTVTLHSVLENYVDMDTINIDNNRAVGLSLADKVYFYGGNNRIVTRHINDSRGKRITAGFIGDVRVHDESQNLLKELSEANWILNDVENYSPFHITNEIEQYRRSENRIVPTVNNTSSSRGHLFLCFKIAPKNSPENSHYFTIADFAGQESPIEIMRDSVLLSSNWINSSYKPSELSELGLKMVRKEWEKLTVQQQSLVNLDDVGTSIPKKLTQSVFKNIKKPYTREKLLLYMIETRVNLISFAVSMGDMDTNLKVENLSPKLKEILEGVFPGKIKRQVGAIRDTLKQSVMISESLLHAKAYLISRKTGKIPKADRTSNVYRMQLTGNSRSKWHANTVFYQPTLESQSQINMIPLLKYHANVGNFNETDSRFIMVAAIRDQTKYTSMTKDVLKFAQEVSSA